MPWGDGTGPAGYGPMTGRAAGYCAGFGMPGFANPSVPRMGMGWGFGRGGYGRGGYGRGGYGRGGYGRGGYGRGGYGYGYDPYFAPNAPYW
jgi:hypothetical protein